ncbi:MAG: tyrosine--tRNA ligase [Ruminococcaceae bacterium]|nr:tyrosine--tRNA ligase [Oscillospiraceae bacterium]
MKNVFDVLKERGLIAQMTHEDEIRKLLAEKKITFYIGFDPTADSLHIGHFMQLVVMKHMQNAGHRPIILLGGGTTMVGDPTGKTDMRPMISRETIQYNADRFKEQMSKFIDFSDGKAIMVNNADWLLDLNYVDFLREVGVHFSVNRMLSAECFKARMERGLSFLEFNYMLMQSYDFYKLHKEYDCIMEFGGDDQWSNIIGGIELIRRKDSEDAYGMTFTLLTTSEGKKMGKTEKGALWLDPEKVTPYEFYQYWRNVDDKDVIRLLKLVTFVPMEEIAEYEKLEGQQLNAVKERLAFEVTKMVHGEEEAKKANDAAKAVFGAGADDSNMPTFELAETEIADGINIVDLLAVTGLAPSKGEGRRLVQQGGVSIDGNKIDDIAYLVEKSIFNDGKIVVKKGKKVFLKVVLA